MDLWSGDFFLIRMLVLMVWRFQISHIDFQMKEQSVEGGVIGERSEWPTHLTNEKLNNECG